MYYTPFVITQRDVDASSTLEQSDVGRYAIVVRGCIQFIAGPDEDGMTLDEDGKLAWRFGGEMMPYQLYMRRTGQWPI